MKRDLVFRIKKADKFFVYDIRRANAGISQTEIKDVPRAYFRFSAVSVLEYFTYGRAFLSEKSLFSDIIKIPPSKIKMQNTRHADILHTEKSGAAQYP